MDEKFSLDEIAVILSEKTGKSADETRKFLRELIILMNDAITTEQIVKVKGIGTFKIIVIKERESVHVNTGERIVIPAHHKLSFTPDKSLKELINKPFSFFEAIEAKEGGSGITEAVITAEDDEEEDDLTPDEKSEADEINAEIREILHNDAPAPVSPPPPPSFSEEGPVSLPPLKFVVDQEIEAPAEEIQPEDNPLDTPDTDSANEPEISKIEDVAPAEDRPVPPPPPYSEEWRKRQQVPPPPPPVRNQVIQAPVEKIQPETNPLETFDSGDIGEYHVAIVEDVAPAEEHPVPPPPPPSVIDQEVQASLEEIHPEAIIVDTSDADDAGEQAVIVEDVDPAEEHPVPPPPPPSVIDQELQAPVEEIQPEVITSDTSDSGNANEQDINGQPVPPPPPPLSDEPALYSDSGNIPVSSPEKKKSSIMPLLYAILVFFILILVGLAFYFFFQEDVYDFKSQSKQSPANTFVLPGNSSAQEQETPDDATTGANETKQETTTPAVNTKDNSSTASETSNQEKPAESKPETTKPAISSKSETGSTFKAVLRPIIAKEIPNKQLDTDVTVSTKPEAKQKPKTTESKPKTTTQKSQTASTQKPKTQTATQTTAKPAASTSKVLAKVKMEAGSRLTLIAEKYYGNKIFWVYLYEYNKAKIGSNPNVVPVGLEILVPAKDVYGINANDAASVEKARAAQAKLMGGK